MVWIGVLAATALISACATASAPRSDWSRAYVAPPDAVWETALETLYEMGYDVTDHDRDRGRLRAETGRGGPSTTMVLELRFRSTAEWVRVSVEGRPVGRPGPAGLEQLEREALELLALMDEELPEFR